MPLFLPPPPVPRAGVVLVGPVNGVNQIFTSPDKFIQDPTGSQIAVYYNGDRIELGVGNDYVVSESVPGLGFDTVTLPFAPKVGDKVTADYLIAP